MDQGNIVAVYQTKHATVYISDAYLASHTPAQIEANRREARAVAMGIFRHAMDRGRIEGITPEEWQRRFGKIAEENRIRERAEREALRRAMLSGPLPTP
jgi:hypothetical protein